MVLNAIMGVMQESKAEKALDALKNMSAPHARVIRDGKEQMIDAVAIWCPATSSGWKPATLFRQTPG
ncbi:MAG: hypothetical protein V8Q30_11455 [Acutalibacteraceae bacterium]